MAKDAYLHLQTGEAFPGKRFGAAGESLGELVFTTGMTGYLETLTDKNSHGQLIVQTFPLIGNYGVIPEDFESERVQAKGYIVREVCAAPSNFRSKGPLEAFLAEQGVTGLYGVDTRRLTRLLCDRGGMNAFISDAPELSDAERKALSDFRAGDAVAAVSCKRRYRMSRGNARYRVALLDLGVKRGICEALLNGGCELDILPHDTPASEIFALKPDGVVLSNGPGDPADNLGVAACAAELCGAKLPVLGVCMGHQLLALSQGAKARKLPFGHRGANQPVRDETTGRVYITSQNHGFAVQSDTLPKSARTRFVNVNDHTCEGVEYGNMPALSVQFFPETCSGPQDTSFLYDSFFAMMEEHKHAY